MLRQQISRLGLGLAAVAVTVAALAMPISSVQAASVPSASVESAQDATPKIHPALHLSIVDAGYIGGGKVRYRFKLSAAGMGVLTNVHVREFAGYLGQDGGQQVAWSSTVGEPNLGAMRAGDERVVSFVCEPYGIMVCANGSILAMADGIDAPYLLNPYPGN